MKKAVLKINSLLQTIGYELYLIYLLYSLRKENHLLQKRK